MPRFESNVLNPIAQNLRGISPASLARRAKLVPNHIVDPELRHTAPPFRVYNTPFRAM